MQQIQRMTKNQWGGAMDAVNTLVRDLNTYADCERWVITDYKMVGGCLWIVDTIGGETEVFTKGNKHQVTVFADGDDYFAYPWFCYDGFDNAWTGRSAKGKYFTIVDELPVIEN